MRKFILLLLVVFFTNSLQSQTEYRLFSYYEGYVIKKDGSKERGFIQYLDETDRYKKVIFRKTKKDKRQKFGVKDIKGYKVADVTYHAVEFKGPVFKNLNFLIVEAEGCINKYGMRKLEDGAWKGVIVYQKDGKAVSADVFALNFAKKMSEFIKDDKELATKVKNKEKGYRILAIDAIIEEYNTNCVN